MSCATVLNWPMATPMRPSGPSETLGPGPSTAGNDLQKRDDATHVLVSQQHEHFRRHHHHAATPRPHAVPDDPDEFRIAVFADGSREIGRDDTPDHRFVKHDDSLGLLAVAAAEAAANGGQPPPLDDRCGIRGYRHCDGGNRVGVLQHPLGENVDDGVRNDPERRQASQGDADPAQQTLHRCFLLRTSLKLPSDGDSMQRTGGWRMGWDSNPRRTCALAGFQDRCLQPLGHPSAARAPRCFMPALAQPDGTVPAAAALGGDDGACGDRMRRAPVGVQGQPLDPAAGRRHISKIAPAEGAGPPGSNRRGFLLV